MVISGRQITEEVRLYISSNNIFNLQPSYSVECTYGCFIELITRTVVASPRSSDNGLGPLVFQTMLQIQVCRPNRCG